MFLSNLEIDIKSSKSVNWIMNPYKIHQRLWMGFENLKSEKIEPNFLFRVEDDFKQEGELKPRILVLSNISPSWEYAFAGNKFITGTPKILNLNLDNFIKEDSTFRFSLKANPTKKTKDYRSLFKNELEEFPRVLTRDNREKYREGKDKLEQLMQIVSKDQRDQLPSKRVGIYKDHEQVEWLIRKGKQSGFQIQSLSFVKGEKVVATKETNLKLNQALSIHKDEGEVDTKETNLKLNQALSIHKDEGEVDTKETNKKSIHNVNFLSVHFTGVLRITNTDDFKKAFANGIGSGKAFGCGMLLLAGI